MTLSQYHSLLRNVVFSIWYNIEHFHTAMFLLCEHSPVQHVTQLFAPEPHGKVGGQQLYPFA